MATKNLLPEFSLAGKVIVVSGGARGLGLTQAEALIEAGADVHALDVLATPSTEFAQVAARAKELGRSLTYHQVDVRDTEALQNTIFKLAEPAGIHGLIAAAGIMQETPALEYTAVDVTRMLDINVTGVFMTAQAVAKAMLKAGTKGSMCLIASMSGTVANRGLACPAYNTSKGAVKQLAKNLASEWAQYGIRVNSLSPGYIATDMVVNLFTKFPEREAEWAGQNMMQRLSSPKEFRGAAVFLMSEASSFMTGSDLIIDGGHTAW
ncbi:short chain dehydrogenase/oxidoreductase-like protein [Tricharina praecox]|uniref:short chain dehydrogenase/oxidoreductase-like protein n=1 Tax=Tricharina praecox TaxID=43433 RepID=UPI0022211939|nr:short chain dehydrogenase/oxidoreductase-like protein [Tricharina praecox]KAI5844350.1 short chain dehydrogenase/oxidoreductase-like protein [Tricharina praecox]